MLDIRRITLFCLEKRLSKHKMIIFSKNLGVHGPFAPLATPMALASFATCICRQRSGHERTAISSKCLSWSWGYQSYFRQSAVVHWDHGTVNKCIYCKAPIAKLQSSSTVQHRFRSKHIFGGAKNFGPNFTKLAQKVVVRLLPTNFLPQKSWRPFFGVTSKKGLPLFFYKRWALFLKSNNVGRNFFPDFQRFPQIVRDLVGFSRILPEF